MLNSDYHNEPVVSARFRWYVYAKIRILYELLIIMIIGISQMQESCAGSGVSHFDMLNYSLECTNSEHLLTIQDRKAFLNYWNPCKMHMPSVEVKKIRVCFESLAFKFKLLTLNFILLFIVHATIVECSVYVGASILFESKMKSRETNWAMGIV